MNEITKHIERMMKPFREIEKITEPLRRYEKLIAPSLKVQKILESPLNRFQKSFENINKIYSSYPRFENPLLEHLKTFQEIGRRLKEYTENTPEYFLLIAQNGWFIDLECDLGFPSDIAFEFQENSKEKADNLLIEYYSSKIDRIFEKLIERHPNRKLIFNQILKSYKDENYFLLIPNVLTQVDGICFDFTKKKFFIKERNNKYLPQITSELEKSADSFLDLYLSPLQNQTPIMVRETDIYKFPCKLNRHEILHGINTDYGTKINSLKVISLLKYLSDMITDLDKKTLNTTMHIKNC